MCAIGGGVNVENREALERMLSVMAHRGPDDTGVYRDEARRVELGHRRLSIIDLTNAGHQPMSDAAKQAWVVFNGEIYNYKPLRAKLEKLGRSFRSQSDTEVIAEGYAEWGTDVFKKLDGMWAVALYDAKAGKLFLSRDPAGIKPLFVWRNGASLLFASELTALRAALPARALSVNDASVARFIAHGYLYTDETVFNEVTRVPAGSVREYALPSLEERDENIFEPARRFETRSLNEGVAQFDALFGASVRATLQADVPVGLFLSGGIDSALTGYHIKAAGAQLTAFTVGFEEAGFDESGVAARIAEHFDFPHVVHTMRARDVAADLERVLDAFGEPFADTSALPTFYVSKLARKHGVKVALGGDGADELFGGYQTHYLPRLAEAWRRTPRAADFLLRAAATLLPGGFQKLGTREKLARFAQAARNPYPRAHARWKRVFTDDELARLLTPAARDAALAADADFEQFFERVRDTSQNELDEVMKVDFYTFLQGSCLVKSDIASMQHSLEVRVPFLNKDLIDFAWFLPPQFKAGPFSTKRLLRAAAAAHLPRSITRLPKRGFVPPLNHWLAGELKLGMLSILSRQNIDRVGFLNYNYVVSLVEEHCAHRADNSKKLWALMSLVRFFSRHG
jgi:asparagine synthase (glutamine-hydrolysing)